MKIVHISDIHIWRLTWDPRELWENRAMGIAELALGRTRKFHLERMRDVVNRIQELAPDHLLITGDFTTSALPSELQEAARLLTPLLENPARVTVVPGNHDRTPRRSFRSRRFEATFEDCMPSLTFPWLRWLDDETAILGLDPTRAHFAPRGDLPAEQLHDAMEMISDPANRPTRLLIACHYPLVAPLPYTRELFHKRINNDREIISWLAGIGPHLYCCGHVHAAWAFRPRSLPNQICLNAGALLIKDPKGLRLPGFLEIQFEGDSVAVTHHAWDDPHWQESLIFPATSMSTLVEPMTAWQAN